MSRVVTPIVLFYRVHMTLDTIERQQRQNLITQPYTTEMSIYHGLYFFARLLPIFTGRERICSGG